MLLRYPPGPTKCNAPTTLPTDAKATIYPHLPQEQLLHGVAIVRQDADKRMTTVQQC